MILSKRTLYCTLGLLLYSCARSFAQVPADAFDLAQAQYYESPNVASWPAVVALRGVEYAPDPARGGVKPLFERSAISRWPDVLVWSNPNNPNDGYIQFTLYAFVKIGDRWHGGGMHEFWGDRRGAPREWTGAPVLGYWNDWTYWAPTLQQNPPRPGSEMAFMLVSGDRRRMDKGDVRERSNVIIVPVMAQGVAEAHTDQPPPTTQQPPQQPPSTTTNNYDAAFQAWAHDFAEYVKVTNQTQQQQFEYVKAQLEAAAIRQEDILRRLQALPAQMPSGSIGTADRTALYGGIAVAIIGLIKSSGVVAGKAITTPVRVPVQGIRWLGRALAHPATP